MNKNYLYLHLLLNSNNLSISNFQFCKVYYWLYCILIKSYFRKKKNNLILLILLVVLLLLFSFRIILSQKSKEISFCFFLYQFIVISREEKIFSNSIRIIHPLDIIRINKIWKLFRIHVVNKLINKNKMWFFLFEWKLMSKLLVQCLYLEVHRILDKQTF